MVLNLLHGKKGLLESRDYLDTGNQNIPFPQASGCWGLVLEKQTNLNKGCIFSMAMDFIDYYELAAPASKLGGKEAMIILSLTFNC